MSTINVKCIDQTLTITNSPVIASGGVEEDIVQFDFSPEWDGYVNTAIFYQDKGHIYYTFVDENNSCVVPKEATAYKGTMFFGVFGVKGDVTRTSEVIRYKILDGTITPGDPSPDIYQQILAELTKVRELSQETLESEQTFETNTNKTISDFTSNVNNAVNQYKSDTDTKISDYKTSTDKLIKEELSKVYRPCGSVATEADLPTNAQTGDVYDVKKTGTNWVWTGTEWDSLAGIVDTSKLVAKTDYDTNHYGLDVGIFGEKMASPYNSYRNKIIVANVPSYAALGATSTEDFITKVLQYIVGTYGHNKFTTYIFTAIGKDYYAGLGVFNTSIAEKATLDVPLAGAGFISSYLTGYESTYFTMYSGKLKWWQMGVDTNNKLKLTNVSMGTAPWISVGSVTAATTEITLPNSAYTWNECLLVCGEKGGTVGSKRVIASTVIPNEMFNVYEDEKNGLHQAFQTNEGDDDGAVVVYRAGVSFITSNKAKLYANSNSVARLYYR